MDSNNLLEMVNSPWVKPKTSDFEIFKKLGVRTEYRPKTLIYTQGEESQCLYYVQDGKVKVFLMREDGGSEKILGIFEPKSLFGESSCIDGHPYFASAIALEHSVVYKIDRDTLVKAIGEEPEIALKIMSSLVRKMRLMGLQLEDLSFADAFQRVSHMLVKISSDYGRQIPEGRLLDYKVTCEELGSLIGASRVTVSRIIGELSDKNIIRKQGRTIIVLDEKQLRYYAFNSCDF